MSGEVLPTMVPGDDEDPIVLDEIVDAALSANTHRMLHDSGRTVLDVLAGNVPELNPVEIIVGVWDAMLPDDEYARAMAQLPDLLEEYQTADE
jgi:hypothetical protein